MCSQTRFGCHWLSKVHLVIGSLTIFASDGVLADLFCSEKYFPESLKLKNVLGNSLWPFLGWLTDPFERLSDLQLGDKKITLNHLVEDVCFFHFEILPFQVTFVELGKCEPQLKLLSTRHINLLLQCRLSPSANCVFLYGKDGAKVSWSDA